MLSDMLGACLCHITLVQAIRFCWILVIGEDHVVFGLKCQNKPARLLLRLPCEASKPAPGSSLCSVPVNSSVGLPVGLEEKLDELFKLSSCFFCQFG